ncbi:MAG: polymorphic toxin-type HINT domain-containing protein [Thermoguttaceae bacterium]|jgi:hypothetical protein
MKLSALAWVILAALVAVGWGGTDSDTPAGKPTKTRAAAKIVNDVLRSEAREPIADRAELLKPALEQAPNYEDAMWQSGYVFDPGQKEWLRYDEVPAIVKSDNRVSAYRAMRPKYAETVNGQMELARWCLKRNLSDQARVHLTKVLEMNQDQQEARRLLNYRLVANNWVSEKEIVDAQEQAKKEMAAFNKWKPKLEKIGTNLNRGKRQNDAARQELMSIRDPEAACAMAIVLCADGGPQAMTGIEALKNLPGREPAAALTQLALFMPWDPPGKAAAIALGSQKKHDYVPQLLSLMQTPVQSQAQIYQSFGSGTLLYRQVFYSQGQDQKQLAVLDTPYQHVFAGPPNTISRIAQNPQTAYKHNTMEEQLSNAIIRKDAMEQFQADAMQKAAQVETTMSRYNMKAEAVNSQLCNILSHAIVDLPTGGNTPLPDQETAINDNLSKSPSDWYQWWNDYNEVYTPETPPQLVYINNPTKTIASRPTQVVYKPDPSLKLSCLVGDTSVWTEMGPVSIKEVAVGDRVFACDMETGCLALKPVLKKTVRPKEKTSNLVSISTGGQKILASGGHVFCVAGEGWVKARDLEAGMRLHTLNGTANIEAVGTSQAQETYNLIVADFHTFFAGEVKTLTHDNTIRQPTNMVLPGLSKQAADLAQK